MSRKASTLLEETVGLLTQHFGVDRVRAALAKVSNGADSEARTLPTRVAVKRDQHQARPSVTQLLERLQSKDVTKHHLLKDFFAQLKDKKVLPESQDLRQFAQLIGLKQIRGKSRKDLVGSLMRFLLDQPTARLQGDIERAKNISEQERQQGYSVLTDKLLGEK